MALDTAFLDELRARLPIASVIGRRTKLSRSGRNWKACCPFHGEKTPSFYVYDDHFHCFGCGAHGDVISFVMQSEGRSFPEAVEQLAGEAGLDMPKASPREQEQARQAKGLGEVLEAVQASYRRRLFEPEGREGLAYLRRRGLSDRTIEVFGLGWSGDGRGGLIGELERQGIERHLLVEAGLMRVDEEGRPKGELFFNRVIFPIRDRRGRLLSFGGRTLGDGQPKYLNGPETALFSKRRNLFNLDLARAAMREGAALIVVEGYMDAIALHQAGFPGAVAPLGTAMGPEQLEALWHVSPLPILCFDGDAAGSRAALRTAEVALPLLGGERSLRVCRLAAGDDPDSLIQRAGPEAMRAALAGSASLSDALFDLVVGAMPAGTPEERAAIRSRLVEITGQVGDRTLGSEYRGAMLDRYFAEFRGKRGKGRVEPRISVPGIVAREPGGGADERLRVMTAILLRHPDVLPQVEHAYCRLELPDDLAAIRAALLDWAAQDEDADAEGCNAWMLAHGLGDVVRGAVEGKMPRAAQRGDDLMALEIAQQWWHFYGLVNFPVFQREVMQDVREATLRAYEGDGMMAWPEELVARMNALETLRKAEEDME